MALSLPYPSMTFVPLDVLTADQMNHIVSNYAFIANQFPIAASNIASNAVTSAKIASAAVTTAKIADANVTSAKIADKAVTPAKVTANFVKVQSSDPGAGVAWPDANAILIAVV